MLLIFYAFGRELAPLRRRFERRWPLQIERLRGFQARTGDVDLVAVATGVGPERAGAVARRAFEAMPQIDIVIATGVAGALSPGLAVGDIVIADRVIFGRVEDALPQRVFEMEPQRVEALQNLLNDAGLAVSIGAILTSDRVLATAEDKRRARQESGAIAVDMESAAVAAEAAARGLPIVCVRAVMDAADDELVGAGFMSADGRVRVLKAARTLLGEPSSLLQLPRVMRNLKVAAQVLADALDRILNSAT